MTESKEGGYGWVVVVASFLIHFIVGGVGYSASVFQHIFGSYFQADAFETSWISALILGLTAFAGIPSVLFIYQFGHRVTAILGGLTATVGLLLSLSCQHIHEVYLTVGALLGLGLGLALIPAITILQIYFYKRHHTAIAIAGCGTSLGIFVMPLALSYLEEHFAWKGMALILAGATLNICLCGATFAPIDDSPQRRRDLVKLFHPSICRSPAFVGLIWCNLIWGVGISVIYTYLPGYSVSTNEEHINGVMLIAVSGISAFTSRAMFEIFSQSAKLDSISMFLCTIAASLILTGIHPQLFTHFAGQIGYAIMLGMHTGFWTIFLGYITEEFIGAEYMCLGKGYVFLSICVGFLGGPPLAGWILDETDDYEILFYLAGSCLLASSIIMMVICLRKCYFKPQDWNDCDSESSGASGNRVECKLQQQKDVTGEECPLQLQEDATSKHDEAEVQPLMAVGSAVSSV